MGTAEHSCLTLSEQRFKELHQYTIKYCKTDHVQAQQKQKRSA